MGNVHTVSTSLRRLMADEPDRYAQESAWREEHRRADNGAQVRGVVALALKARPSVDFCGYWQRAA